MQTNPIVTILAPLTLTLPVLAAPPSSSSASSSPSPTVAFEVRAADPVPPDAPLRWHRGNLHTHSLWSDGNDFPEMIAEWYRVRGYDFLALSDHNVLSAGERWMPLESIEKRGGPTVLPKYLARFGPHWVERRDNPETGAPEVRLKPLDEFRALVEERGRFLMIEGEEITDSFRGIPIHMNATNVSELIEPQHGAGIRETIANNIRAVAAQAEATGRPILHHLNHPNFQWAITAEDIAAVVEERFFEVFNGHGAVHNLGDERRAGTERIWDIANTIRLAHLDAAPLFGIATDDSHHYHNADAVSMPGIGWIMVHARHLTPESIIRAMEAGDFYASTGVTLRDVRFDAASRRLHVVVEPAPGATYSIRFVGTRRGFDETTEPVVDENGNEIRTTLRYSDDVGTTLLEVEGPEAIYAMTGDELYVRAVVTSSLAPEVSMGENERRMAWTQPVGWRAH